MLTKDDMLHRMANAADLLKANVELFSEIDAHFGDGDHGITVGKIADLIHEHVANAGDKSIQDFFTELGFAVVNVKGGSAGPLYGTMIGGFGEGLHGDETAIDASTLKAMFAAVQTEMEDITTAQIGDKTMMDALLPAIQASQTAPGDVADILTAASEAAQAGCKASEGFVAKFGRARSYKEQTIGTPDAGAASTATFLKGLAEG